MHGLKPQKNNGVLRGDELDLPTFICMELKECGHYMESDQGSSSYTCLWVLCANYCYVSIVATQI